jgi:Ca2+/H+ antiporter
MSEVRIALAVAILALAGVAYEIAGLTVPGWHTISFFATQYLWLRLGILGSIILVAIWWWWHSGRKVNR